MVYGHFKSLKIAMWKENLLIVEKLLYDHKDLLLVIELEEPEKLWYLEKDTNKLHNNALQSHVLLIAFKIILVQNAIQESKYLHVSIKQSINQESNKRTCIEH